MSFSRNKGLQLTSTCLLVLSSMQVDAASYQRITEPNYENPASMGRVNKFEAQIGDNVIDAKIKYTGRSGPLSGTAVSDQTNHLPYGKLAWRVAPKFILGLNVTQPVFANVQYPKDSFVRFNSSGTVIKGVDISPRLAYQPNKKLTFGLGFNASRGSDVQFNFFIPPARGELINKGTSWAYGFNLGLTYMVAKGTILSASYYSALHTTARGTSTLGAVINPNLSVNLFVPALWSLNAIQFLTKKWLVTATASYAQWDKQAYFVTFDNTALGTLRANQFFNDTLSWQLGTRYQLTESWAVSAGGVYNPGLRDLRYQELAIINYAVWAAGIGAEYALNKSWVVKGGYAYGWGACPMNSIGLIGPLVGQSSVDANLFNVSLTYKV